MDARVQTRSSVLTPPSPLLCTPSCNAHSLFEAPHLITVEWDCPRIEDSTTRTQSSIKDA